MVTIIIFTNINIYSQVSIYKDLISSNHSYFENSKYSFTGIVGEPVINTITNSNVKLYNGFLNNISKVISSIDMKYEKDKFFVYPNPSNKYINLNSPIDCDLHLVDVNGNYISSEKISAGITNKINVDHLSSGNYILMMYDGYKFLKSEKLLKL